VKTLGRQKVWPSRFQDFDGWREENLKEKLNYTHANAVNRGLVQHPKDWLWSSWPFYFREESELVPIYAAHY